MKVEEKYIIAYALKNALDHLGKAQAGSVLPGLFACGLEKDSIKEVMPEINRIVGEINSKSIDEQKELFEEYKELIGKRPEREGLAELFEVPKSGVVMRFSPSPSGPMHIGHALSGLITSLYVEKYGGKFYLQIEDTNPENIYVPAYEMLVKEAEWIFGNVSEVIIQSDRIELYYKYVEKLLKKDAVYVCGCKPEKFKHLIDNSQACPCRKLTNEEQKKRWKKMLEANGYKEGEVVLRFKSNLNDPNPAMRDFPLARINESKHPRQGTKYRVWPLMNLSVTVDDIELKKTHVIRAKDHRDNAKRQEMIYEVLGLSKIYPKVYFLGRYNFTDMPISASKTRKAIEEGKYSGWDDIRLPFLDSLRKRGFTRDAFAAMVVQRGLSEVDKKITQKDLFEVLANFNREILKDVAIKVEFNEVKGEEKLKGKSEEKNEEKIKGKNEEKNKGKSEGEGKNKGKGEISANAVIMMPDGSKKLISSKHKPKKDEIIYFPKLGYARFNGKKDGKDVYWYAHP